MVNIIHYIYCQPLYRIVAFILFATLLWIFLCGLFQDKPYLKFWKLFNVCLFCCSCVIIVYSTIFSRTTGILEIRLIPFYSYVEALTQEEMYRTNLMNVFLFFPFGLSLSVIWSEGVKKRAWLTVLVACVISVSVELVQLVFKLGRVEIDDVIHNTLGAVIGAASMPVSRWRCLKKK